MNFSSKIPSATRLPALAMVAILSWALPGWAQEVKTTLGALKALDHRFKSFEKMSDADPDLQIEVTAWVESLRLLSGTQAGTAEVFLRIFGIEPLWNAKNEFQLAKYKAYAERTTGLKLDDFQRWSDALTSASAMESYTMESAFLLLETDSLFPTNKLSNEKLDLYLARVTELPNDAILQWAEATGVSHQRAAVYLVTHDSLFDDTNFKPEIFQRGLKKIEKKSQ